MSDGVREKRRICRKTCDKPHYENEAPFEVPSSWEWTTIGDIAESNIGLTYKPTDICDYGIPVYRSNNIQNRCIDKTDLVRVDTKILDKQFLAIGDLLICARNGSRRLVGKCALIEELTEPTSFGAFMAVCRSIYNPWIYLLLNTNYFDRYLDDSNSTTINQVTQTMLLAFKIPFPPKKEQERVIKEVHKWFNLIDEVENESERLQAFITATKSKILDLAIHGKLVPQDSTDEPASELLKRINPKAVIACDNPQYENLPNGWCWTTIEEIGEIVTGSTPSKDIEAYYGGNIPFFKPADLEQGIHTASSKDRLTSLGFEQSRKLPIGSILVTCIGATIGKTGLTVIEGACNQQINAIIPRNVILPHYLYCICISDYMQNEIKTNASATTLPILNKGNFSKIILPLPPLQEQHRIFAKIEELFAQLDNIASSL